MPYQPTQNYYYQPSTSQMRQPLLGLKGRPVSGLEEVRAAAVDFDGTVKINKRTINLSGLGTNGRFKKS